MTYAMRTYSGPFVLAVCVHALVFVLLWFNWAPTVKSLEIVQPRIIKAELVMMQPRPKPAPKPEPAAAAPAPKVEPKPEPKPTPVPKVEPKPQPKVDDSAKRAAEEKQRKAELDKLNASALDDALAREAQALQNDKNEQAAMSYAQGIYKQIVQNWSRPPSARTGMEAQLLVELVPTGDVVSVTLVKSSGSDAFDRSAEQAVRKVGKFDVPKESDLFERYFRKFPVLFKPEDLLR